MLEGVSGGLISDWGNNTVDSEFKQKKTKFIHEGVYLQVCVCVCVCVCVSRIDWRSGPARAAAAGKEALARAAQ